MQQKQQTYIAVTRNSNVAVCETLYEINKMEMKLKILVVFFLTSIILFAQEEEINILNPKFSSEIEDEVASKKMRQTTGCYNLTYIGEYEKAIQQYELYIAWGLDSMSMEDSLSFMDYQPKNAFEYLEKVLPDEELVIISEAHQKPQHRIFTRMLLETLYENGFRYLGLETLNPKNEDSTKYLKDRGLNERGYPLNSYYTGGYTREPQMGNMIRTAHEIGFKFFGYEKTEKGLDRDLQQALNVKKFMDNHTDGKVVIHCGWYHAIESDFPKGKTNNWLAYHLKQMTGKNPLTIYQDILTERGTGTKSPYYELTKSEEISVLLNEQGDVFNGKKGDTHFDLFVYHPPTKYINGRPNWLLSIESNTMVEVKRSKLSKLNYPIIIQAFLKREDPRAVPVDQIELKSDKDKKVLILKPGKYKIVGLNKNREEQSYNMKVK